MVVEDSQKEEQLLKNVKNEANSKRITFESDFIEDDEQHSDAVLIKCDKEIELLQRLMREPECGETIIDSDGKYLGVPSGEEMLIESKET